MKMPWCEGVVGDRTPFLPETVSGNNLIYVMYFQQILECPLSSGHHVVLDVKWRGKF